MNRRMCSLCKIKMRFRDNRVQSLPRFETVPTMLSDGALRIHLHDIRSVIPLLSNHVYLI